MRRLVSVVLACTLVGGPAWAKRVGDPSGFHRDAGQAAFDEGNYSTAVELLSESIAARPTPAAYTLLGNCYVQLGRLDEANKAYDDALQLEKRPAKRAAIAKLIATLRSMTQARLHVESSPAGATVYVDLKAAGPRGKTPIDLALIPGRHRIIYSLDGYDDAVALPDPMAIEGQTVTVETTLRRKGCDLSLGSRQKGVIAALDGNEQIPLPATVRVTPGKHEAVLYGRGMQPVALPFECRDFKPIKIERELAGAPGGLIRVHATAGNNIYIDGKAVSAAESARLSVPAGPHDVEVEAPGNAPWHATVVVRPGEQTEVTPQLHAAGMGITGVEVQAVPAEGTLLWLDGSPLASGVMTATTPGAHVVEARARGFRPLARKLDLRTGEVTRVEARMQKSSAAPLALGIAFTVLAAGAEAGAIAARVREGREVVGSSGARTWRDLEIAGHATAGGCAAVAIIGFVVDALQRRNGLEKPRGARSGVAAAVSAAPAPSGGSLVVTGSF